MCLYMVCAYVYRCWHDSVDQLFYMVVKYLIWESNSGHLWAVCALNKEAIFTSLVGLIKITQLCWITFAIKEIHPPIPLLSNNPSQVMISKIGFRMLFQTSSEIINNVLYNNPIYFLSPGNISSFFSYIFNFFSFHDINIKSEFGLFFPL